MAKRLHDLASLRHTPVMNTALWVVQGLLAVAFVMAGVLKMVTPRTKLMQKMKWAETYTDNQVRLIGLAELAGGIGLVVPWWTMILPILTPIAAVGLALIMAGAVVVHVRRKEAMFPALILGLLCVFVALGRFGVLPY